MASHSFDSVGKLMGADEKRVEYGRDEAVSTPPNGPSPPVINPFHEGGKMGWLAVLGGALVSMSTFGVVQSFGVFQDFYQRVYLSEHTPSEISWIGSLQVCLLYTVGLGAGRLFDAGYFHHCVISGAVVYLFCSFMLSLAKPHHYYQIFLAQGVGMGIGMGLMLIPCLSITSHYFRRQRALAMGLVVSGSSIGAIVYPIVLNNILPKPNGFAWGIRTVAFMNMLFLLIANMIMRTRYTTTGANKERISVVAILKDIPYIVFIIGVFLIFWGTFVPFFYLQSFAQLNNVTPKLVKYSLSIMNAVSFFGRILPNFIADRYGALNVMIPSAITTGALIFGMLGASNVSGVVLFGMFYGLFSGACLSIAAPAATRFTTRPGFTDLGSRMGVLSFCIGLSLLTGNPIAGALLTQQHLWIRPLIFASVSCISGGLCLVSIWPSLSARRGTKLV